MSRFVISCGGTGGHLSPGIALAEGLAARGHQAQLLISRKKVDARLVEKYAHLEFIRIPSAPFTLHPAGFARFLWQQTAGFGFSLRFLRAARPDAIIGFGGFTTASIVVAGWLFGIPVALHEANRVPGRAIRLLKRLARRIYLPLSVRLPGVRASVLRHTGLPVRREIVRRPRDEACARLGLDPAQKLLVVLGGSQGAAPLNQWARDRLELLAAEGIQVYCVTGLDKGGAGTRELRSRQGVPVACRFSPFCDEVAGLLSAADLVVSRAGAGTIAELIRCETPAILIPYPQAADNHQWANASFFEQQGGGIVVDQMFAGELHREVLDIIFNDWLLQKFRANLRRMELASSLDLLLDDIEELTAPRSPALAPVPSHETRAPA